MRANLTTFMALRYALGRFAEREATARPGYLCRLVSIGRSDHQHCRTGLCDVRCERV